MAFELIVARGGEPGPKFRFRFDAREVTIGRAPENHLVVHDPGASRGHARIRARGAGYALLDDGSCNGTQLNERPMRGAVRLRSGDRIQVGTTVLEFAVHRESRAMVRVRQIVGSVIAAVRAWPWKVRVGVAAAAALAVCLPIVVAARTNHATAPLPRPAMGASGNTATPMPELPSAAEMFPGEIGTLREVRESYERGRRKVEERRIAPRNLYDAWRAFTAAGGALQTTAPASPARANLSELVRWAERELEAECKRLLFGAARSERYGQEAQALAAFGEILLRFPGDDPSGCRKKAQEALASAETAAPAGGVFGYPEAR
jgi:pSer/pThr/pTyr-binding forkhead associated (FHA) protein